MVDDKSEGLQQHLKPRDVAKLLGVSVKTIYRWVDEGKLEAVRVGDKLLRIPISAVKELISPVSSTDELREPAQVDEDECLVKENTINIGWREMHQSQE